MSVDNQQVVLNIRFKTKWQGTRDRWLQEEFNKPYRKDYESTLAELIEDRMVSWLEPKGEWGSTLTA